MIGNEIYKFAEKLWPFDRSITGPGLRQTLNEIKDKLPNLKINNLQQEQKCLTGQFHKSGRSMRPI